MENCILGQQDKSLKKRWRGGGGYRNQKAMYEAILKYGWDNIKHIVLISNLKEDMAMEVEKALIEKYSTQDTLYGYNTKNGGQHFGEHSEQFLSNLKERMSDIALKRSVIQMDLNGKELNKFNSVKEAAESVGAFPQNIGSVCSGKQKSCKGFLWRYEDDNSGRYQTADKET